MSDRIDELVATIRYDTSGYTANGDYFCHDSDAALTELATIAREAQAGRDEWIHRCYQSDERARTAEAKCEWLMDIAASHAVAANLLRERETRDEYKARLLKAAEEAVER